MAAAPECPVRFYPSSGRNPSPRPFPLKGRGWGGRLGSRDPFRSKGRVIKQEGRGIFSELDPEINVELCSPSHPFCLVVGGAGRAEGGGVLQELANFSQTWASSPVPREEKRFSELCIFFNLTFVKY